MSDRSTSAEDATSYPTRERELARTFSRLANTLVGEVDAVDLMHVLVECSVDLLDNVDAAALILNDQRGHLEVVAATTPQARLIELLALAVAEGPCLDCVNTGEPIVNVSTSETDTRWPRFIQATHEAGHRLSHALPMRLHSQTIGALSLFGSESPLDKQGQDLGQAFADVATIGLLRGRSLHDRTLLAEQLQATLNNRTLIEQAKGMVAQSSQVSVEEGFMMMLEHSRQVNVPITKVAAAIINGSLEPLDLLSGRSRDPQEH